MTYDINKIIDESKLNWFKIHLVFLSLCIVVIEGFEMVALGFITPNIASDWGLKPEDFMFAHLSVLIGILFGSVVAGILTDKIGRRKTLLLMFFLGTVFMGISCFIENMWQLIALRLLTGFGAGGALPVTVALVAEYAPKKFKNLMVVLAYSGAPLGSVVGGFLGPWFMADEQFGWAGIFVLGFILSLPILIWMSLKLPQSLKYLVLKNKEQKLIAKFLNKVSPDIRLQENDETVINEVKSEKSPISELFASNRKLITPLLWLSFIASQYSIYIVAMWLPSILQKSGWDEALSAKGLGIYNLGGFMGGVAIGIAADRIGAGKALAWAWPIAALLFFVLSIVVDTPDTWFILAPIAGAFAIGGTMAMAPFAASLYPTSIRGTGVGSALGFGRIGGIMVPFVGAAIMASSLLADSFYHWAMLGPGLCSIAILLLLMIQNKSSKHE